MTAKRDQINITEEEYDPRPIGIFDSGIGGLTVLKSLLQYLPHESFIYLGDTARLPYGSKSPETIQKYCDQNIKYLIRQEVKSVILACNSASSFYHIKNIDTIPIYNVIEPGSAEACKQTKNGIIGVLGTRATIKGQAYIKAIHQINPKIRVLQQSCPLFVPLAEEGPINDPITKLIIHKYLDQLLKENDKLDTLVLGCTHYPILKADIQKVVGPHIKLIESGNSLGQKLLIELEKKQFLPNSPNHNREIKIEITDHTDNTHQMTERILFPDQATSIALVDLNNH